MYARLKNKLAKRKVITSPFFKRFECRVSEMMVDKRIAVSRDNAFLYFRIPKAANSTVVSVLYFMETGIAVTSGAELKKVRFGHYGRPSELSREDVTDGGLQRFFKFAIVRHPAERFLSFYMDKVESANDPDVRRKFEEIAGREHLAPIRIEEAVEFLESDGNLYKNAHWAPQTALMTVPYQTLDYIGRFENLSNDLAVICRRIFDADPPDLSWRPHATNARAFVRSRISRDLERRLFDLYRSDYEAFGYDGIAS